MAKVYTVRGSEDGTIGVFTTITKAFRAAMWYCGEGNKEMFKVKSATEYKTSVVKATLSNVQEQFKAGYNVTIDNKVNQNSATIQMFNLNEQPI